MQSRLSDLGYIELSTQPDKRRSELSRIVRTEAEHFFPVLRKLQVLRDSVRTMTEAILLAYQGVTHIGPKDMTYIQELIRHKLADTAREIKLKNEGEEPPRHIPEGLINRVPMARRRAAVSY